MKIANFKDLKSSGSRVQKCWLSDIPDAQDLAEVLGGNACVWGYSASDWDAFQAHKTFDENGAPVADYPIIRFHQFAHVLRQGDQPDSDNVFPHTQEAKAWLEKNLSPHVIDRILRVSDDLSGFRTQWDPFGKARKAGTKPSSDGGVSTTSGEPSEN